MRRTLSSRWTFAQKYLFPLVWSGGFGFGTLLLLLHPERVVFNGVQGGASRGAGFLFLAIWAVGTAVSLFFGWRVKWVHLEDRDLVIAGYFQQIRVPLGNVQEVRYQLSSYLTVVTVEFVASTPFGRRISFLAQRRPWQLGHGQQGQVSEELQRLVADAQAGGRPAVAGDSSSAGYRDT